MSVVHSTSIGEMKSITLYELLERSAESALELQRDDGSFPSGRNYTYDEPSTPVRTTSHWAVTLSEVYEKTGKDKFREAANAAVDYLLSDEVRPHGYTYHCRNAPGEDRCNGLIGQAHPIRALVHAGLILNRQDAINTAEEVFIFHPFDEKLGLWEKVEIDGKKLSFDRTLNHQILFAAGGSKLASESEVVDKRINTFLNCLSSNMSQHSDGLIKHYIRPSPIGAIKAVSRSVRHWPLLLNEVVFHYYSKSSERRTKEIGYQPVNFKGLARLRMHFPRHEIWSNIDFQAHLRAYDADECSNVTYGSVIPGMSFALAEYAFCSDTNRTQSLIETDLEKYLNTSNFMLESDVICDANQSSTISILAELPDRKISLTSV